MEEETQSTPPHHSTIDTSSPFTSVKEAVAIFGKRLPSEEIYSSPWSSIFSPSPTKPKHTFYELLDHLKRLETELEKTKMEVKLLKERESETEVALASLNAKLHVTMSKIARAEAARARTSCVEEEERCRKRRLVVRLGDESPSLAQILSASGDRRKMTRKKKKKSIVPCFGELFSWKKGCVY